MLNKIKEFLYQKTNEVIIPTPVIVVDPETTEQKIIGEFKKFTADMEVNENFPKRAIEPLHDIFKTLNEIDSQTVSLQEQALIRKIVDKEIPQLVELYLSLPKAHAVSYILENGKTSKDTLILKLNSLAKQISKIWEDAVQEKTNLLIRKQKNVSQANVVKKDFFDL